MVTPQAKVEATARWMTPGSRRIAASEGEAALGDAPPGPEPGLGAYGGGRAVAMMFGS